MTTAEGFRVRFLELCQSVERREARGRLSQKDLAAVFSKAKITEATQPNISRWLSGATRPRYLETYERLAAFAGVSPGWLAFGKERPMMPFVHESPKDERIVATIDEPTREDRNRRRQRRRKNA